MLVASLKIAARLTIEEINYRLEAAARRVVRKIVELIVISDLDLTAALSTMSEAAAFERTNLLSARRFSHASH
jgi:hypothetical protein